MGKDGGIDAVVEDPKTKIKYFLQAKAGTYTDSASANTVLLFLDALTGPEDEKKQSIDAVVKIAGMTSTELNALDGQLANPTLVGVPAGYGFGHKVSVPALRRFVETRRAELQKSSELRWRLVAMIGGAAGFVVTAALQIYQVLR